MKWIDIPPIWLAFMAALTWGLRGSIGAISFGDGVASWLGAVLIMVGLFLMVAAVMRMAQHRTTPVPHMQPTALVTDGVFGLSRNPIYLGDVLILSGLILRWDAPLAIPLILVFVFILRIRFIFPEEDRLKLNFSAEFDEYARKTRRWL